MSKMYQRSTKHNDLPCLEDVEVGEEMSTASVWEKGGHQLYSCKCGVRIYIFRGLFIFICFRFWRKKNGSILIEPSKKVVTVMLPGIVPQWRAPFIFNNAYPLSSLGFCGQS